jgi:hypothetical protein
MSRQFKRSVENSHDLLPIDLPHGRIVNSMRVNDSNSRMVVALMIWGRLLDNIGLLMVTVTRTPYLIEIQKLPFKVVANSPFKTQS